MTPTPSTLSKSSVPNKSNESRTSSISSKPSKINKSNVSSNTSKNGKPHTSDTTSKASRSTKGPKNPQHKLYRTNHHRINKALCACISERRVNIKACELYHEAKVTAPTFYLHFRSSDDVLTSYETELEANLLQLIPSSAKKITVLTMLTDYIIKHRQYFLAVNSRQDHHMLMQLVGNYRLNLVGNRISDDFFALYVGKLTVVLSYWLTFSNLTPESSSACVHDLMAVRVGKVW